MDLDFSPEDLAFRNEVRAFVEETYPARLRDRQHSEAALTKQDYLAWHRTLADKGWIAPNWPKAFGGTDWTPTQKYIFSEELARSPKSWRAPTPL
jgi:alkylation response protein AidB-like acyl-CoA dehydrogenase